MTLALIPAPPAVDTEGLRRDAQRLSAAAQRYESAVRRLATRVAALPNRWHGAAASAALRDLEDLQEGALAAAEVHTEAAEVLLICAARVEEAQHTWSRAEALAGQDEPVLAERLAEQAQRAVHEALDRAAAAMAELASRAPFDGADGLSVRDQVGGFGSAAVDAVWGSVVTVSGLSLPRMLADREGWLDQVRGMRNGAAYALDHPREAGKAAVGWDLLREGRYGEWAGGFAPDLLSGAVSGGSLPVARRAADLGDDLGDLAEDVDDLQRVHGRGVPDAGGPVEPQPGAVMAAAYPRVIRDLTPERRQHILDGDPDNPQSGGHRAGTGRGKSEFPASWSDDDIIRRVMDTAMRPDLSVDPRPGSRNLTAYAEHDGVLIRVVVDQAGAVVTAYPVRRRPPVDQ